MATGPQPDVDRPPGLPERYEIIRLLGAGGMGRVFHARDRVLGRDVAIKVLADHCASDESYTRRFLNEARTAASLNDPGIVQIYEYGNEIGCVHLVMEYVDGVSLKTAMGRNGRYSEGRATELIGEACRALGVAHGRGVVHRDVKPDNMMLTSSGVFKLIDLGLAKQLASVSDQTATGRTMGTPHYISPEQILGAGVVDHRADIYSLGASLYCLATGSVPFDGSSGAHIMSRHLNDPVPNPRRHVPELSEGFCRVVARAMAKDPARRHQDTGELERDLAALRAAAPAARHHIRPDAGDPTVIIRETPSGAVYCPVQAMPCDESDLECIEQALARAIGPFARVLVGREGRLAGTRDALVELLAGHVSDARERRRFLKACGAGDSHGGGNSGSSSGLAGPVPVALDPETTAALTRHLAAAIGPVARVLVQREVAAGGGLAAVVERLATHVPDADGRECFLRAAAALG